MRSISSKMAERKDVGAIIRELTGGDPRFSSVKQRIPDLARRMINGQLPRDVVDREVEVSAFNYFKPVMERRLGVDVVIHDALNPGSDLGGKAKAALPGRPSIFIE